MGLESDGEKESSIAETDNSRTARSPLPACRKAYLNTHQDSPLAHPRLSSLLSSLVFFSSLFLLLRSSLRADSPERVNLYKKIYIYIYIYINDVNMT